MITTHESDQRLRSAKPRGLQQPSTTFLKYRMTRLLMLGVAAMHACLASVATATTTWDGKHDTSQLDVTVVYFVPADREPLPDWNDRAAYYCRRIEQFHDREFQGSSTLTTHLLSEPLISQRTTAQLRQGDGDVYHEGCGHTVGLPHPEPGNGSVMSLGQYRGWISESWLDREQKLRMGWEPTQQPLTPQQQLFSEFRALPEPRVPRPGDLVDLSLSWPAGAELASLQVRYQTAIEAPWVDVPQSWEGGQPQTARLGRFDRETPVSYRIDARLTDGSTAELWGYLQVRQSPQQPLLPKQL
ncbi:hypothetical protein EBU58_04820, partial [bacterium]|nr:hypothetical protein [bacterium]